MLNIFDNDAFSVTRLTTAINELRYAPGRVTQLGLFMPESVNTLSVAIERDGDALIVVPPTPRGGPGVTMEGTKRDLRSINIPHFQIDDSVMADEVQGVRAFGSETVLETVIGKVVTKQGRHVRSLALTEELARLGAVKGIVVYADGSTLNLFQFFDMSNPAFLDFDLLNANPSMGDLRNFCDDIDREMAEALGGLPYERIHALVGKDFFKSLLKHPEIREIHLANQQMALKLLEPMAYKTVTIGNITFEEYRGSTTLGVSVTADEAHFFPVGVPELFKTFYGPADYEETVNTMGLPRYTKQWPMQNGKGRHLESQTNALNICTRPKVLMRGKVDATP